MHRATIKRTTLGPDSCGRITAFVFFDGLAISFGGYDIGHAAAEWIAGVTRCAGVDRWEDLPGREVRIVAWDGLGATAIGHATEFAIQFDAREWDRWRAEPTG